MLLLSAAAAAWWQLEWLVFLPVLLLGGWVGLQYPQLLFYILLATIPWSVEFQIGSLGTDLPDEPLMLLSAFAALSLLLYHRKSVPLKSLHPLLLLLIVQFCWIGITALLSTYPLISIKYTLAKGWYLLAFVVLPLFLFRDRKVLIRSAIVLATSMLVLMMVSIARHAQYDFSFEKINPALEPFFRNHVTYSSILVLMVPLLLIGMHSAKSRNTVWLWRGLIFITIVAIYLSYARGAWLALAAGMITYWLLKKGWLVKSYLLFLCFAIAAVLWLRHGDRYIEFSHDYNTTVFHTDFSEHLVATYQFKDVSTAERYYRWIAGVRMVKEGWQTGFGPATFYNNYKSYTVPAFKTWVSKNEERSTVHNYFLLLLVEQGVIGFLLFVTLLGTLFWYAQKIYQQTVDLFWKRAAGAAASILVMISVVNFLSDLIETDKVGSIFYLCVAVLVCGSNETTKKLSHEGNNG